MESSVLNEVDIILAGGGTTACVIAGRLAAANPNLSILIIEAGPTTLDDPAHIQPSRYNSHLLPASTTIKFNVGKESHYLGDRTPIVPCGQCLGGGSSVNFAMYTRPAASDYDDWERLHGSSGWGFKDLLPLFRKMETYQAEPGQELHGYDGPLKVSYGRFETNVSTDFLQTALKYDTTRELTNDLHGFFTCNAYGRWPKFIDLEKGRRSDVPHSYIFNKDLKNLHIVPNHLVKRVIIENGRAVGVVYSPTHPHVNDGNVTRVAKARRMVVVSAGAFGSPTILERSGIGGSALLQRLGVDVVVDLPGVGENFQDHNLMLVPYIMHETADTLGPIIYNDQDKLDKWTAQWLDDGSGIIGTNGIDAGIKMRPSSQELAELGPEFNKHWNSYFADAPDKPVLFLCLISGYGDPERPNAPRSLCSMAYYTEYPASIGHVHISSGEDVYAPLDFDPKYLSHAEDVAVLRWGYKHARELARRMSFYRGEYLPKHPRFPEGSNAACCADRQPASITDSNLVYTEEDNKIIDEYTRQNMATSWHSLGTCAMKPREQNGVVDFRLNVYGVSCLKVADMSIAPANVSANTYTTAVVIGEKAAIIIAEELGLDI